MSDSGCSASEGLSNAPDKQVTHGVVENASRYLQVHVLTPTPRVSMRSRRASKTMHPRGEVLRPGSPGIRITEGHLRLMEQLLGEQHRNLLKLPAMGRRTGRQCLRRGSGPVVVDGVTTIQGVRENLAQGKGV